MFMHKISTQVLMASTPEFRILPADSLGNGLTTLPPPPQPRSDSMLIVRLCVCQGLIKKKLQKVLRPALLPFRPFMCNLTTLKNVECGKDVEKLNY